MGATIRDVAREAGVSPATVSRVYNDSAPVREETRKRVLATAKRLRYVPNGTARSLSINKTHVLGFVLPEPHREFFSEIIRGIDETAHQAGYNMLVSSTHNRLENTHAALRVLRGRVDGLIVMSPHHEADLLMESLSPRTPVAFIMTAVGETPYDAFQVDNEGGGYEATRHLLEQGHRRIAIIKGPDDNLDTRERLAGYREALREAGVQADPSWELSGAFTRESGIAAAERLLELDPRPTAVFAMNDYMAFGALGAFQMAGLNVPGDVALVGFDDIMSAQYVNPPLSSIRVSSAELGRRVTQRLLDLVGRGSGLPDDPLRIKMATQLVVRDSSQISASG
ncbi:MAG: substrate-binding domain-containing protein [Bacteroidetes bacterium]|jgi:LacI family transcriptional regulator|nr:substrate-binding domain-containing protein [Bacteroidota bacterium]